MEKHGFRDHGGGTRFPTSRDWDMATIECAKTDCVANHGGACVMPSRVKIGADGKCKGYRKCA